MQKVEQNPQSKVENIGYSLSAAMKIILIYAAFSSLWILVSDSIVSSLFSDPIAIRHISIAKGWLFVVVTALLLYGLIRRMQIHAQKSFEATLAAQEKSAESERLIRTLYDAMPDLVWFKDSKGVYLSCNSRFEQFFGASESAILGKSDYDFVDRDLANTFRANDTVAMEQGTPHRNEELVTFASDGHRELLETTKTPVLDSNGQVIGVLGIGRDISERKGSELALKESEARWKFAIEGAGDGLWDWNIQTGKAFYSPRYKTMLGFANEEIGDSADEWSKRIHPDDAPGVFAALQPYLDGKVGSVAVEYRMLRKDGSWIWTLGRGMVVERDAEGKPLRMIGTNSDITQRRQTEELLKQSEARIRSIFESAADAMFITDQEGHYQYVNHAAINMLGFDRDALMQMSIADITAEEDLKEVWQEFRQLLTTGALRSEFRLRAKDGTLIPVDFNGNVLRDGSLLGVCRDITQRKQLEDQVRQLAFYDNLTALANRRLFDDRLRQAVLSGKRSGSYSALMFLDLDNFKPLNDVHGHKAGDLLLIEVAKRMKACVRETDTIARFGGDEFVVLLVDLTGELSTSLNEAARVAEKIRRAIDEAFVLTLAGEGHAPTLTTQHHCTASIGVAMIAASDVTTEDALRGADKAMYEAKEHGRNQVCFSRAGPHSTTTPLRVE
jgi:diguanylate cyclase (GGDEF)-like protein/PAS domain S-box-containing protein